MTTTILQGDVFARLPTVADKSVQMCLTSPPFFALRSYLPAGHPDKDREIGSEPTPDAFVATMVAVFRLVREKLRDDAILVLNLGDSYAGSGKGPTGHNGIGDQETRQGFTNDPRVKVLGGRMRLRVDLTPGERAYVLAELAKAHSISDDTQEGRE